MIFCATQANLINDCSYFTDSDYYFKEHTTLGAQTDGFAWFHREAYSVTENNTQLNHVIQTLNKKKSIQCSSQYLDNANSL